MGMDPRAGPSPGEDLARLTTRLVCEVLPHPEAAISTQDLMALVGRAWMMGAEVALQNASGVRACRICGCTELTACNPPCSWVARDLCSACLMRI